MYLNNWLVRARTVAAKYLNDLSIKMTGENKNRY